MGRNLILVGGPDTGKTNFLARLVVQLRDGKGAVRATQLPDDMRYIEDALAYLMKGEFAPRSHNNAQELSGEIELNVIIGEDEAATISVPDVSGETWDDIARTAQISQTWLDRVQGAAGALLFVRVLSDLNVQPMDWVNAPKLFAFAGEEAEHIFQLPTQVLLCEFLRLLEENLSYADGSQPRVAVIVTAFDRLDPQTRALGPKAFLKKEFPLFFGKLQNTPEVTIGVFGSSVAGGELADAAYKAGYLENDLAESGYIVDDTGAAPKAVRDMSRPVAWVLGQASTA